MGMVVSYFGANGPINPAPVTPFSNVVLLCGFETGPAFADGVNDESSYAQADGGGTTGIGFGLTEAQKKFGVVSLRRDTGTDTNSSLQYIDSAQFAFGANPFTIECWAYFETAPSANRHYLIDQFDEFNNQRSWALLVNAGSLQLRLSADGTAETAKASAAWSPSLNTWYHVAGDFDGTTYRTYVNGALMASSTGVVTLHNSTSNVEVARARSNSVDWGKFDGYIDEIRVCKSAAYASGTGFVPPTAAFPRS